MIELLRAAGPDLGRRWLAALLVVPADERETVVRAVERRVVEEFAPDERSAGRDDETLLDVADDPIQRDGYVEQVIRTYARRTRRAEEDGHNGAEERRSAS